MERSATCEVFQTNLVGFVIDEAHCVKKWYFVFDRILLYM